MFSCASLVLNSIGELCNVRMLADTYSGQFKMGRIQQGEREPYEIRLRGRQPSMPLTLDVIIILQGSTF